MFRNNLKIAWRNLLKDRQFTILNLIGLSAGLACTIFIYLWVNDELSFDKFNEKDSQLYQLMEYRRSPELSTVSDESCGLLSEVLRQQRPEIEYAAAVAPPEWFQKSTLTVGDKNIKGNVQYVGQDYFNIFSFKLLDGNKSEVLSDKNSIVISETMARKLFGTTENLLGKTIRFQHEKNFAVSGVFEDVPRHSSQQFDFVLSFEYYADSQTWVKNWYATGPHNFVILKKGTDIETFNKKISKVVTENSNDTYRTAFAMKFSDNYLQNSFDHGSRTGGRIEYIRLFSLIAIFILAIACINFMNLSTAKASRRLKEVGIKKVVGAGRRQLIFQFLGESLMLTFAAVVFALAAVVILLPQFNVITGKQIDFHPEPKLIAGLLIITLFTGLLSGSYPALYLSGFNPIKILKGKLPSSTAELLARKGLVVFQFSLTVVLIVGVMVVYQQMRYIQSTKPGYNKDNIVRFDSEGRIQTNEQSFVDGLKKIPGVVNASFTFNNIVGRNYGTYGVSWEGKHPNASIYFEGMGGGDDFIETMEMEMAAGRPFSKDFGDENSKIIINEAAAEIMGFKDPVGKNIKLFDNTRQIIGVVKNFHFESFHETVKPLYMTKLLPERNPWLKIMVRIKAGQEKETIERMRKYYEAYNPGFLFDFSFLDQAYQKQYEAETKVALLSKYFAGLAILISCLGLYGLVAFTAQRRQKEIGIRKVIGARVSDIVSMLSLDFLKLVVIAVLIAFPIAWLTMKMWLNGFVYRTNIDAMVFVLAAVSILFITILTISYQAIRSAVANPVRSLRTE